MYQPGFEDVDTTMHAAVPFYGIYDFTNRSGTWHKERGQVHRAGRHAEALRRRSRGVPLLAARPRAGRRAAVPRHPRRDTLAPVEDAREFVRLLREVSEQPVLYAEMPGAQHAFEVFPRFRTARVIEGVERFLHSVHRAYLEAARRVR